jgi:hypothetical protein
VKASTESEGRHVTLDSDVPILLLDVDGVLNAASLELPEVGAEERSTTS